MPFHYQLTRVAIVATSLLFVCTCATSPQASTPSVTPSLTALSQHAVLERAIAPSLYEIVFSPAAQSLFVASAGDAVRDGQSGSIYRLDPQTLEIKQKIDLPLKPFALAADERSHTLYVGHTLDGAVSAIDMLTGAVKSTLYHGLQEENGKPVHTRQVLWDADAEKLYVTGITDGGLLWVIDAKTFTTEQLLRHTNAPTTGMALDAANQRLYVSGTAAYAAFDTRSWQALGVQRIAEKLDPTDARRRFLVNVALDVKGGRLFANQLNNSEGTLVFDLTTGELLHTIQTGETPVGIRFNVARNEVVVASLGGGFVSVIDATTYSIKHRFEVPGANSLWLTPDGQTLYVTAKHASLEQPLDTVVRIDLQTL
ncbi:YncE family protein [Lampropedia puyangensis]|uniref:YncE family protein n=1 Tax=Lampropedia puyangensis TaxID=1330072 RepID=A0A4V4GS83_9BURK|nr:YncE family protein [Lampropedia puyangensis]THU05106.1 YncE family protein [Lampropedia puyangensis]